MSLSHLIIFFKWLYGDTILLNKCVSPGKSGPVFSTGQYCLLVGAGETAAFLFLFMVVTLAREHH